MRRDPMTQPSAVPDDIGTCEGCGAAIARLHDSASCPACGAPLSIEINRRLSNPESRRLLAGRGILPYEDEPAVEPPVTVDGIDRRTAGFIIRAVARGIDVLVSFAISLPATLVAFLVLTIIGKPGGPAEWAGEMQGLTVAAVVLSMVGSTLYGAFSEWIGGATLGKLACGLRVMSEDFSPLTFRGALVRSLAFFVDGMFFGFVGLYAMQQSALQQRYGDRWGRTIVVSVRAVPESSRGAARLIVGMVVGCGIWGAFLTCASVTHVLSR
jgi:uncharacterized RDD family membrane protein YckC